MLVLMNRNTRYIVVWHYSVVSDGICCLYCKTGQVLHESKHTVHCCMALQSCVLRYMLFVLQDRPGTLLERFCMSQELKPITNGQTRL